MRRHRGPQKKASPPCPGPLRAATRGPGPTAHIWPRLLILLVAAGIVGCGSSGGSSRATLTITPEQYSLSPEQTREFQALLRDSEGIQVTNPTISWTVEPAGLGELTLRSRQAGGPVTGEQVVLQAQGEAGTSGELKARSADPLAEATVKLRIVRDVDYLEISPSEVALLVGDTQRFTVQAFDMDGSLVENFLPYWTVDAQLPEVGTVDQNGRFTARSPGSETLLVQGSWAPAVQAEITVVGADALLIIEPGQAFVEKNTERQFRAFMEDSGGNRREVQPAWSVSGNIGAISAEGLFLAGESVAVGQVQAQAEGQQRNASVQIVEVAPPPGSPNNIEGTIRAEGQGVGNATVEARDPADNVVAVAITGADGHYGLWLPAGTWLLHAAAVGFQSAQREVTLETQNLHLTGVDWDLVPL